MTCSPSFHALINFLQLVDVSQIVSIRPLIFSKLSQSMGTRFPGKLLTFVSCPVYLKRPQGNYERIMTSITVAKSRGATLRVGPELEIP